MLTIRGNSNAGTTRTTNRKIPTRKASGPSRRTRGSLTNKRARAPSQGQNIRTELLRKSSTARNARTFKCTREARRVVRATLRGHSVSGSLDLTTKLTTPANVGAVSGPCRTEFGQYAPEYELVSVHRRRAFDS